MERDSFTIVRSSSLLKAPADDGIGADAHHAHQHAGDGIQQPHQRHHQHPAGAPAGSCWGRRPFPDRAAAMVFGSTSANTSTTKVSTPGGDRDAGVAGYRRMPTMVPSAEARMLTRLLPMSTRLIRRSGLRSSFSTRLAGRLPCFAI